MDSYLGEIRLWTSARTPTNWAVCDGSALPITSYESLYTLIGTAWGGDGVTTFKLPDLRGRLPIGQGQGPGLTARTLAQTFGSETVALTTAQLPAHTHSLVATTVQATTTAPSPSVLPAAGAGRDVWYVNPTPPFNTSVLAGAAIANSGAGASHANLMPGVALNFIICTNGIYPNRTT